MLRHDSPSWCRELGSSEKLWQLMEQSRTWRGNQPGASISALTASDGCGYLSSSPFPSLLEPLAGACHTDGRFGLNLLFDFLLGLLCHGLLLVVAFVSASTRRGTK